MNICLEGIDENTSEGVPDEILLAAENVKTDLLPEKSKRRYEKEYEIFCKWIVRKGITSFDKEDIYLVYFSELSASCQPSTLWSKYSMLKTMLKLKKNIDISRYFKVIAFLKKKMVGFRPKKSKILSPDDVEKFLSNAPDNIYLLHKVATIFGIAGACRREELTNLLIENVKEESSMILVKIPDNKTHTSRSFVITGERNLKCVRKYTLLRPKHTPHKRFFVQYHNGECSIQCVGINKFGKIPSDVAAYLRLPHPEAYTGHCYRRSSATALADAGVGITNLKRHGGWQSTKVAEGYLDESLENKKCIASKIFRPQSATTSSSIASTDIQPGPSTQHNFEQEFENELHSTDIIIPEQQRATDPKLQPFNKQLASAINLSNANNCTFTINYNINN